ncbi:hypothetical protein BS50DRAFT_593624 [Corynespora cassiicola Philippines]|uniref:MARVEL domain-containing protein n=1 Tax=Corynespora cassiicola Philippines TaxID=1448308 RepID=A0A2T2N557_CORCC|nr:hypothetical protein BS50DRAFT_593624 [Corynespora cassiicola Philippines]
MPFSVYLPAGGTVPTQRYFWIVRAFQLLFAFLILVLTSYALSVHQGGPIRPALIATNVISVFTMIPILPLVTPLHDIQDKIYDPRIALLLKTIATLFWLAAFSALASHQDNYSAYGSDDALAEPLFRGCTKCRHAWRTGEAVTAFSILEL